MNSMAFLETLIEMEPPICKAFADEFARAKEALLRGERIEKIPSQSFSLEDYRIINRLIWDRTGDQRDLINTYLQDKIKSINQTQKKPQIFMLNGKSTVISLKTSLPAGKKVCIAAIAFDNEGNSYDGREIERGVPVIRELKVEADGLTWGFGTIVGRNASGQAALDVPGYFFDLLPAEVQQHCSFVIPEYRSQGIDPSPEEIDRIIQLYQKAANNLYFLLHGKREKVV